VVRDEFLGRDALRASLGDALDRARRGAGSVVVLTGEPGIGKTTVALDVADRARRSGATVRWAACWPGGATVAHGPWLTVLTGLGAAGEAAGAALAGAAADGTVAATSARASAYAAVTAALERATAERPLVVVLDDLHWADEGTVQLLAAVAGQLPAIPVLVVGAYRDTEVVPGSALTRLTASADRIQLHGLDVDGVAAVLGGPLGRDRADGVAAEIHRRTAGNPFLVVQVGRLLAADPSGLDDRTLPTGARDLLEGRLASLAPHDRTVLVGAAVFGMTFTIADVAAVLDAPVEQVAAALDRAAAARVVERVAGVGSWAFVHDLFREATLAPVGDTSRRALHARAATTLVEIGAEPATVAHHFLTAGDDHSGDAARWSTLAGHRAVGAFAWEEAAAHYERALAALGPGDTDHGVRADALLGLGQARLLVGDAAGAGRAFDGAAGIARKTGSAELLARAALGFSADLSGFEVRLFEQRQIDLLEEAAAGLEAADLDGLRATVLARLSVALSMSAPRDHRLALAETAVNLARNTGEPAVLGRCLAARCDALASPDRVATRLADASEIVAIGERESDGPLELLGRRLRLVALLESGDFAAVDDAAAAFARRAETVGNPLYSWYVPLWAAQRALVDGDLRACDTAIDEARTIGRSAGSTNAEMLTLVISLVRAWAEGDYRGAVDHMTRVTSENPDLAVHLSSAGAHAMACALAGRTDEARLILDRCASLGTQALPFDGEWLANVYAMLEAAVLTGHPIAEALVPELTQYSALVAFEGIGAGIHGPLARVLARACSRLGRDDEAVGHARVALDIATRAGGLLAADAMRTLAECLDARGSDADGEEAATMHARADAIYRSAGALHHVRDGDGGRAAAARAMAGDETANELRRDGDVWHVRFGGTTTIVKHSKGMADLAVLLAAPGREFHVSELEHLPGAALWGDGGDAIDRTAVAAYRRRLEELAEEIDDADTAHDPGRAERARTEYDALVDELSRSLGLGGRARAAGSEPVERLRKAVSARVRDAIRRVGGFHPELGRHLTHSVRTGIFCSYRPETPVSWRCQTGSGASGA
jgi:tetratricopeptide (TPR) repeat protein